MIFPTAIEEMRRSRKINASVLIDLDFLTVPKRIWLGAGDLKTINGLAWEGVGAVLAVDGGGQQVGLASTNISITFAATAEMWRIAKDSTHEINGRRISTSVQFFNEAWQPIDNYFSLYNGVMDRVSFQIEAGKRTITLFAESPFVRKRAPRIQYWSASDQNIKFANDRFLDSVAGLENKVINWPTLS